VGLTVEAAAAATAAAAAAVVVCCSYKTVNDLDKKTRQK